MSANWSGLWVHRVRRKEPEESVGSRVRLAPLCSRSSLGLVVPSAVAVEPFGGCQSRVDLDVVSARQQRMELADAFGQTCGTGLKDVCRFHLENPIPADCADHLPSRSASDRGFLHLLPTPRRED